jgi:hypothetical protein
MLTLWCAIILSQSAATGPVKVAATDFTFVGIDPKLGAIFQDRFVSQLGSEQLRVTTQRDIQQLLGLERERQLLGCDSGGPQCMAELAGALGVEVVINGSIAKSESGFIVTIRALKADTGQSVSTPNTRVKSEGALLDWLDATAGSMRGQIVAALRPQTAVVTPVVVAPQVVAPVVETKVEPAPASGSITRWIPAIAGGALALGGGVCLGISGSNYLSLTGTQPPDTAKIHEVRVVGETMVPVGAALLGVGVAGVVTSLIWNGATPKPVQAAVVPVRDGAVLSLGGELP